MNTENSGPGLDTGPSQSEPHQERKPALELYESRTQSWRARWVQVGESRATRLHRLSTFADEQDDWFAGDRLCAGGLGRTVCGIVGEVVMPGIFSRMDAPRCRTCCNALGLPYGQGAPYNDKTISADHPERQWQDPEDDGSSTPSQDPSDSMPQSEGPKASPSTASEDLKGGVS